MTSVIPLPPLEPVRLHFLRLTNPNHIAYYLERPSLHLTVSPFHAVIADTINCPIPVLLFIREFSSADSESLYGKVTMF